MKTIKVDLKPATGEDTSAQWVCMELWFYIPVGVSVEYNHICNSYSYIYCTITCTITWYLNFAEKYFEYQRIIARKLFTLMLIYIFLIIYKKRVHKKDPKFKTSDETIASKSY